MVLFTSQPNSRKGQSKDKDKHPERFHIVPAFNVVRSRYLVRLFERFSVITKAFLAQSIPVASAAPKTEGRTHTPRPRTGSLQQRLRSRRLSVAYPLEECVSPEAEHQSYGSLQSSTVFSSCIQVCVNRPERSEGHRTDVLAKVLRCLPHTCCRRVRTQNRIRSVGRPS